MKTARLICIVVGMMLSAAAARAEEVTVVRDVLGPEGPLFVNGNLYYVAWTSGTLSKWDGKTTTVLNSLPGCSHNGLALTKQNTFLVACTDEHGAILELDMTGKLLHRWDGNCILKFAVNDDGSLGHRENFALLNLLTPNKNSSWWLGPDSMKIDGKGNMYVAQWFGGKILKIAPDGKLLHVFPIAAGDGTTNVAFGPGAKELYISVVKDPNDPQARGSIVRIPNVE